MSEVRDKKVAAALAASEVRGLGQRSGLKRDLRIKPDLRELRASVREKDRCSEDRKGSHGGAGARRWRQHPA